MEFGEKSQITQNFSTAYNPRPNGLAEAFNKTLCMILMKVVSKNKRDWHERLPEALWAYGTTHRTATQSTPYSLVFGGEAPFLPLHFPRFSIR